ncbi:ATP-dependent 6-phosphofructokinase, partial [Staphylococcus pseudintermedius]|nr:ATP-dependent 6-phosphofructokinase [Staphylococcus pseudintermedius]
VLGHIQRGGSPTGADRVLASRLGGYAVELLLNGETAKGVGIKDNRLVATNFDEIFNTSERQINQRMLGLTEELSI